MKDRKLIYFNTGELEATAITLHAVTADGLYCENLGELLLEEIRDELQIKRFTPFKRFIPLRKGMTLTYRDIEVSHDEAIDIQAKFSKEFTKLIGLQSRLIMLLENSDKLRAVLKRAMTQ